MSVMLFLDESGHDHKNAPYEVRGGVALDAAQLWPFIRQMRSLEENCFGDLLHRYRKEIKGHKLLDKDRFKWAAQGPRMDDVSRRKHCLSFLNKGTQKGAEAAIPTRSEFTAYGQACLEAARGIFQLLRQSDAKLFASIIPAYVRKPNTDEAEEYLRKDFVYLLERFFYYLDYRNKIGLLVMDESERTEDRRFVRRLERYFTRTQRGLYRTARIVPSPFFVSSDMTYPVQAADLCIYSINHAFRLREMDGPIRKEVEEEFLPYLRALEFHGDGEKDGEVFRTHGIVYVPDPYQGRQK
jgi:hypothetical protein